MANAPLVSAVDRARLSDRLFSVFRRIIHEAMRSSIQEIVAPMFVDLQQRVGQLEVRMDCIEKRMDGIELRMDRIEKRMDAIEVRMDRIEQRMDAVERRMDGIEHRMDGIEHRMDRIEQRGDRFEQRMDSFAVIQGNLVEAVAGLRRDRDLTEDILRRVGRLEDRFLASA